MTAKKLKKLKESFRLEAPAAGAVLLAGDFTGWTTEPIPMKKDQQGCWKATVPLDPGIHEYRFMVDGNWADDPLAPARQANPFGSQNCVRHVATN